MFTILFLMVMCLLQLIGIGILIGRVGQAKTGYYSGLDVFISMMICGGYLYATWDLIRLLG